MSNFSRPLHTWGPESPIIFIVWRSNSNSLFHYKRKKQKQKAESRVGSGRKNSLSSMEWACNWFLQKIHISDCEDKTVYRNLSWKKLTEAKSVCVCIPTWPYFKYEFVLKIIHHSLYRFMFYVSDFLVIKYLLTAPEKVHIIQNKHHISFLRKSTELMSASCVINMPVRGPEPQTLVKITLWIWLSKVSQEN